MERQKSLTSRGSQRSARIEVVGPLARIEGVSQFDLDKILTFTMPNYWFSPKYRNKVWDGKIRFARGKWFPVGFVNRVVRELSVPITVIRPANSPDKEGWEALEKYLKAVNARDYQDNTIMTGIAKSIGIINLAANAGKTRCIGGILVAFPKKHFLVLAHRVDILSEIKETLDEFLPEAENYVLSTFKSAKKLDLEVFDGVLVDEAHVSAAKTFYKLITKCINASIRLGFTATPKRPDGLGFYIEAALGEVICTITQDELIKRGISTKPKIFLVPFTIPFVENDNYGTANTMLVNCKERNQLIADLVKDKDEVLVLFQRIEHGKLLEELIEDSVRIDGKSPQSTRETIKKQFKAKKIRVLLASSILDAGVNLKNIKTLVLAWGGKSPIELTQKVGRAIRKDEGKHHVDIFALHEVGNRYFREHSKRRLELFAEMNFEMEILK